MKIDLELARRLAQAGVIDTVANMVKEAYVLGRREARDEATNIIERSLRDASKTVTEGDFNAAKRWLDIAEQRISEIGDGDDSEGYE